MINWNYTAAIIQKMDLIITADTAIAHLAGALGKPCWVLVPYCSDWRWGESGTQTAWYPSLRIIRQPNKYDWNSVFEDVLQQLKTQYDLS
jgi:ADP-heptose:LPS heptosyltransferase